MFLIFSKIRIILDEQFSFQHDQIQFKTNFELELGMDSREMLELLNKCELAFNVTIILNNLDKLVSEGNSIRVQTVIHSLY